MRQQKISIQGGGWAQKLLLALLAGAFLSFASLIVHHSVDLYTKPLYPCDKGIDTWRCMGTYLAGVQRGFPVVYYEKMTLDANTYVSGKHQVTTISAQRFALNTLLWAAFVGIGATIQAQFIHKNKTKKKHK